MPESTRTSVCQTKLLRTAEAVIVDAQTEQDLDAIAALYAQIPNSLWCGSTGLVRAFARTLPAQHQSQASLTIALPVSQQTYVCIGSRNPVSRAQRVFLDQTPIAGVFVMATDKKIGDPKEQAQRLALKVAHAVEAGLCDGLIATGGETAKHIAQALQAQRLHVLRELAPGIPLCALELKSRLLPFVTKAGGFGQADSLRDLIKALQQAPL
jgi:D-threonate/D-erythronate kinase